MKMSELLKILKQYIQLTRIPVGERDYYDQRKVEELTERWGEQMHKVVSKRVHEILDERKEA